MSRKEIGSHFKRILSHTSSGSGNAGPQEQPDFSNTKKLAKRASASESDRSRPRNTYMLNPDNEPLLHQVSPTSPTRGDLSGRGRGQRRIQVSPNRIANTYVLETPRYDSIHGQLAPVDSVHGQLAPVDFRQDCPRGIMSVTDIELTMGDEDGQHNQIFHPPGSPMDESGTPRYPGPRTTGKCCPVQRCSEVSCDENRCLWHRCVLKLPHHVRWEDKTVTIELERKQNETFGFSHKAKQHVGKDEVYILVSKVERGSKAARSGLAVGDLILSVNRIPLQTRQKLSEVNLKTMDKLRLQIQHPLEISSKAATYVDQLAASMEEMRAQYIMPDPSIRLPQPLSPSTSPSDAGFALSPTKENIPLSAMPKPETKSKRLHHHLPQVRVFVCGNATNEFVRCLIGDLINMQLDTPACCFQISMRKSRDGSVSINNSESFSYLVKDSSESCINVELVSVSDDSFFHHCCAWMFRQKSIFILTFDTKRLSLSSASEMSRLCSLAHTVRTGVPGPCTNLKVFGITSVDTSIHPDEVRTLFYTSLGEPLPDPKVIPITSGAFSEEMKQTRLDIFNMLTNITSSETQRVISPTAEALDMLVAHRALTTTVQELTKTLEEWNSDSQQMEPEILYQVIDDLRNTGNLIVTGSVNVACVSENVKEFVVPSMLFDYLSRLTQYMDNDRISLRQQDLWTTLNTSGVVTRPEMQEVLSVCIADSEKLLSCMEDLHLVFPVKVLSQDSGFGDISSILFPYFLEDIPFQCDSADNYEKYAALEFSEDVPCSSFFSLLSDMSHSDECQSITMKAQFVSHMILQDHDIILYFLKTMKQIQIFRKRSSRPPGQGKHSVTQLIQTTLGRQLPSRVRLTLRLHTPEERGATTVRAAQMRVNSSDSESSVPDISPVNRCTSIEDNNEQPGGAAALPESSEVIHVPFPADFMAEMNSEIVHCNDQEEQAQREVLNMRMLDVRGIFREIQEISKHLSGTPEGWETLAGHLGASLAEVNQYSSLLPANPRRLPARTFLDHYFTDSQCTLRHFMEALLTMMGGNSYCLEKIERLWNAALRSNSEYYRGRNGSQ